MVADLFPLAELVVFIIVEFGDQMIEVGDSIVVYEVDEACGYENETRVFLSVSMDGGTWETIAVADGGEMIFYIDDLSYVSP